MFRLPLYNGHSRSRLDRLLNRHHRGEPKTSQRISQRARITSRKRRLRQNEFWVYAKLPYHLSSIAAEEAQASKSWSIDRDLGGAARQA
jgi:hypothetical protein